MVVAFLIGMGAYLEEDAKIMPCEADKIDQAAIRRVIRLIQRHYLKMDV